MNAALRQIWNRFRSDEGGATAVEYALIAVIVSIAATTVLTQIGSILRSDFGGVLPGLTR